MKQQALSALIRVSVFLAPLALLYWYAQNAFESARNQTHRGDTGLGIAVLLGFLALAMLLGFFIDLLVQIRRKRRLNVAADACVLAMLLMPFGWFACQWFGPPDSLVCKLPVAVFEGFLSGLKL
ncbi:hypothetical protein [Pseudomonas sp. CGJS7]|uniref:hypothetical protein n=1 Tax=Pseudomonas sp. CGJS7 TaxID=3109348 RepID=UPI00300BD2A0